MMRVLVFLLASGTARGSWGKKAEDGTLPPLAEADPFNDGYPEVVMLSLPKTGVKCMHVVLIRHCAQRWHSTCSLFVGVATCQPAHGTMYQRRQHYMHLGPLAEYVALQVRPLVLA